MARTEVIQVIDALPDLIVRDPSSTADALRAVRTALETLLEGRTDRPLVRCWVDTPPACTVEQRQALSAQLSELQPAFPVSHLVVHLDARPNIGSQLPDGVGRDPVLTACRRAAARIGSALMHCDDFDLDKRLETALTVITSVLQTEESSIQWQLHETTTVGWKLRNHPIVLAARTYGGRPPSFHVTGELETIDTTLEPFLQRCATLAQGLGDDVEQERRFQAWDRRFAGVALPAGEVALQNAAHMHATFALLARRVLSILQDRAEASDVAADGLLWELEPETEPMQFVCNFGTNLRTVIAPCGPSDVDFCDAVTRLALTFDLLGLTCIGVPFDAPSDRVHCRIAQAALDHAVAEIAVCVGRLEAWGDDWRPRGLPFWPFDAAVPADPTSVAALAAANHQLRILMSLPPSRAMLGAIDELRSTVITHGNHPAGREVAREIDGILDVVILKLAVGLGGDAESWMAASRQLGLARHPEAVRLLQ